MDEDIWETWAWVGR